MDYMESFEAIFTILAIIFIPLLIFTIILVTANYKLFTKAGEEGWKSLIPIYNTWINGCSWWKSFIKRNNN